MTWRRRCAASIPSFTWAVWWWTTVRRTRAPRCGIRSTASTWREPNDWRGRPPPPARGASSSAARSASLGSATSCCGAKMTRAHRPTSTRAGKRWPRPPCCASVARQAWRWSTSAPASSTATTTATCCPGSCARCGAAGCRWSVAATRSATWSTSRIACRRCCSRPSDPSAAVFGAAALVEVGSRWAGRRPPLSRTRLRWYLHDHHFSIEKARRELGYQPRYRFAAALEEIDLHQFA